jgi:hypothetical protein
MDIAGTLSADKTGAGTIARCVKDGTEFDRLS